MPSETSAPAMKATTGHGRFTASAVWPRTSDAGAAGSDQAKRKTSARLHRPPPPAAQEVAEKGTDRE